jgi:hypothetical protein
MTTFETEIYQNEYLPARGSDVSAIVSITSAGGDGHPVAPPEVAEIVIVDTSGSMSTGNKLKAARTATAAAIDCIRDGVAFAVIAGTEVARLAYPPQQGLAIASPQTRLQAQTAAQKLRADGGTAMGSWLTLAAELFATVQGRTCHAILLTDGNNEHETREQLESVLAACEGRFQCDCRGVGTDWEVSELRLIATALLGGVDILAVPDEMEAAFRAMMQEAMGKSTSEVSLRVWTPQSAQVAFLRQVSPSVAELTDRAAPVNALTADYPTGTWGEETREYHLSISVPPRELGDEMLAARVSLIEGDDVVGQGLVKAIWTDDEQLSTRINREVAHYTGQAELADCIQDGLEARRAGDEATATSKLGRAVQLASESGNDATMKLLVGVIEVDDAATGTVRLRRSVSDLDEMVLETRSTKTVRASVSQ